PDRRDGRQLVRGTERVVEIPPHHFAAQREHERAGVDEADRDELEFELDHDAEVPATAADGPQEVRVLGGAGAKDFAAGRDDHCRAEAVGGEAVLANEPADTAAGCQSTETDAGGVACGEGETVRMSRTGEIAAGCAGLHASDLALGVDDNALELREVDDEGAVHHTQAAL